jgi:hypothetical protein
MNYKGNDIQPTGFNTHNTIETVRGTSRKDKDQIMLGMIADENSKMMNSARVGKQIRLKKNLKRLSDNNRYKVTLPNGDEEFKAKSHSRNRSKRHVPNVNTSLVVNRTNLRKHFFKNSDNNDAPIDTVRVLSQDKEANPLIRPIDGKPPTQPINSHRPPQAKPISNKDSQPEVKTVGGLLNESQSEAKSGKPKKSEVRTLEMNVATNKLNSTAMTEINKTIAQLKSCRSPNSSAFTNPQAPKTVQSEKPEFPLGAGKALKLYMHKLTDYEKGEILDYRQVYFLGLEAKKVKGSPLNSPNFGYDNDKGDYKTVLRDHIAYRYEVLEFLGKGSFGQALK